MPQAPASTERTPPALRIGDTPTFTALAAGLLAERRPIQYRASGSSMRPTILDGDLLIIAPTAPHGPRRGDVAFYRAPGGGLRTHRLVGWARDAAGPLALLRGDAACGPLERVPVADILGHAVRLTRRERPHRLDTPWARGVGLLRAARQTLRAAWRRRAHPEPVRA